MRDSLASEELRAEVDTLGLDGERALGNVLAAVTGQSAPATIGRYEIGAKIGAGACGAVYVAHDPSLDRKVAIKVVLPRANAAGGPAPAQARLLREARSLAKLGHPNVVEVFDVGVQSRGEDRTDRVFIVMELVDGPELTEWLGTKPTTPEIIAAFAGAARGLAAAHSVGVVHRDFKPANAMMAKSGRVKVLDFGLAREDFLTGSTEFVSSDDRSDDDPTALTRTGVVLGTPRYMAPEQHAAQTITPACDQYALCVSLWEAVAGEPPFAERTLLALADAKEGGPPTRPSVMSPQLYGILRRGLQVDPARRWSDCEALARALGAPLRPQRRRRWPWGVAALAVAGTVAWAARPAEPGRLALCDESVPTWSDRFDEVTADIAAGEHLAIDGTDPIRARQRLDRFAAAWAAARTSVCTGSYEDGRPPVAQVQCLARARTSFDALVDADPSLAARHRLRRILSLPVPSRCLETAPDHLFARTDRDARELDALYDLPREGADRAPAELEAELEAGRARARALGDHHVAWFLAMHQAKPMTRRGANAEAGALAREATWAAASAGDDLLASESVGTMLTALVEADHPEAEMRAAFDRAREIVVRAGDPPVAVAALEAAWSIWSLGRGNYAEAAAAARRADAAAGDPPQPGTERWVALALITVAGADVGYELHNVVDGWIERAIALGSANEDWGPAVLAAAYQVEGHLADLRGDSQARVRSTRKQRDALLKVAHPDHPVVLYADATLGKALVSTGQAEQGAELIARAYRRLRSFDGELDQRLNYVAEAGLFCALDVGDAEAALDYAADLLELAARDPNDQFDPLHSYGLIAAAHHLAGDLPAARAALAKAPPPDAPTFAVTRLTRGRIALADGHPADAARQALAVLEDLDGDDFSIAANNDRVDAYALLAEIARAEGRPADADIYTQLADERRRTADHWHRPQPSSPPRDP